MAGRHIFEHNSATTVNTFSVDWTAPATGGDVTIYASGLAAGGSGSSSGDQYAGAVLTISEAEIVIEFGGCTYDFACNYNPDASFDDGSCEIESCAAQGDLDGDGSVNVNDFVLDGAWELILKVANFGRRLEKRAELSWAQTLTSCAPTLN